MKNKAWRNQVMELPLSREELRAHLIEAWTELDALQDEVEEHRDRAGLMGDT